MIFQRKNRTALSQDGSGQCLGMDVGSAVIKVARVSKSRGTWAIHLRRSISLSPDEVINLETLRDGLLGQLVERHLPIAKLQESRQVACALSSSVVELQTIELPRAQPSEVRQMIEVEFDAKLDGGKREYDFFANEISEPANSETCTWSVLSIPTQAATGLAESLWKQGLRCENLNTLPCVLSQGVLLADPSCAHKTVVALDWGANTPSLTLVAHGRPIYSRPLRNCGLAQFVKAGCERFDCSQTEFYELLSMVCQHSEHRAGKLELTNLTQTLLRLSRGVFDQLILEIDRTLAYLHQEYPKHQPQDLWLFGGGGTLPQVCSQLSERTQLKAKLWQLPASRQDSVERTDPLQTLFGTAIVLSIIGASA